MSIKKIILSGFFWSMANQLSLTLAGLVITGILSRLILPAEFGLIAMVTLGIGFLNVIKDFGFGAALVQKKSVSDDEYSTVFWFNLMIGVVLTSIVFVCAPAIAGFFKEPKVTLITRVLAPTFIINSIGIVWNNRLVKEVAFKQIFYRTFISTIFSGLIAILMAYQGYGLWALVAQSYVSLLLNTGLNYIKVKWLPSLVVKKEYVKDLLKFGLPLLADQSINYWVRNVDSLLVGRTLGKDTLAYYNRAYSLMLLPVRQLTSTLTKVLFPSFSLIQDDKEQIANIYMKISRVIAFVAFPVMTSLSQSAESLILIVYGEHWRPVIPIFKVLSILGMFQALGSLSGNVYLSQAKTQLMFKIGLFSKGIMIVGIVLGLHAGGLMGMVYGYCLASGLAFLPELYFIGRLINLSLFTILGNFSPYLLISGVCYVLTSLLTDNIDMNVLVTFSLSNLFFAFLYLGLNLIVKPKAFTDILLLLPGNRKK